MPDGESRSDHFQRIESWLQTIQQTGRVLAVTHGGTIDFLYRLATAIPLHGGNEIFSADNASVSRLEINWPAIRLVHFNVPVVVGVT